jgi:hypothetical protein
MLPASTVRVPSGYTVRVVPIAADAMARRLGPSAEYFEGFLNGMLRYRNAPVGYVQVLRLTPRAAAMSEDVLPIFVNSFTRGGKTSAAVVANHRVTLVKNVRGSGLDLISWQRGPDLVLLTAYPQRAELKPVAAAIIRGQRG